MSDVTVWSFEDARGAHHVALEAGEIDLDGEVYHLGLGTAGVVVLTIRDGVASPVVESRIVERVSAALASQLDEVRASLIADSGAEQVILRTGGEAKTLEIVARVATKTVCYAIGVDEANDAFVIREGGTPVAVSDPSEISLVQRLLRIRATQPR